MVEVIKNKIENSLYRGFIDQDSYTSSNVKPKLLSNYHSSNVLNTLIQELKVCKSFLFSVAFITEGGLATLKTTLYELNKLGIKGRILTSTFLSFNNPKTFKELLKIPNLEVRLSPEKGFHSKGYIFEHTDYYSLIVGSSNLTDSALKSNFEWNIYLSSLENGEVIQHFKKQFEEAWSNANPLTEEWIATYKEYYDLTTEKQPRIIEFDPNAIYSSNKLKNALEIKPNKMQEQALKQISDLRATGANKGLIISATGTGKTYLSAFDIRYANPDRILFIVHREQILNKSKMDFQKVLGGNEEDYGILSGNSKNLNARYLFATVQTLSKDNYLNTFDPSHFDYILVDEVHRAGATSYRKVLNYFTPKFLLGMTATPERTDDFNIYDLFDYNIAYEIRLQAALEEDMLCPFHYFGVVDYEIAGETIDDTTPLQKLVSDERVDHLINKIQYYGYSGEKLRGLMFCSKKDEAAELSRKLNERGLKTTYLTGEHSQEQREAAISDLEKGVIEYILTIDIFNEGIDIPFVNQIIMLRQTQSSIIFIQQLGRGLRKHEEKEYVTIIDFIGNYKNNYLIPIALSGDQSMNKDNIRRKTVNTDYIKGISTINFEEIAKKRIFEAINNTNLSQLKFLREHYTELKNRIGRIPTLVDFIKYSVDPEVIINYANTYYEFLLKLNEDIPTITDYEKGILSLIGKDFLPGKRAHEILLLKLLVDYETLPKEQFLQELRVRNIYYNEDTITSIEQVLSLNFFVENDKKKFGNKEMVVLQNGIYKFNEELQQSLRQIHFKDYFTTLIECAFIKNEKYDNSTPFTLYEKYSRREVCRLLNWDKNEEGTLNGGRPKNGDFPIFVNYHKVDDEAETKYMDKFLSYETFRWCTTKNRYPHSSEILALVQNADSTNAMLFVKKDNGEGKDFYYLGKCVANSESVKPDKVIEKGKEYPVVTIEVVLEHPIQYDIYHYLVEEN